MSASSPPPEEAKPTTLDEEGLPPLNDEPLRPYFVIRQEVFLEVNFREKRIHGKSELTIANIKDDSLDEIAIDARQSEIDVHNIEVEILKDTKPIAPPRKLAATYNDPYRLLTYPKHYNWDATHHDLRRIRMRPLLHSRRNDAAAEDREVVGSTPVDGSIRISLKELEDLASSTQKRPIKIRVPSSNPVSSSAAESSSLVDSGGSSLAHREFRITIPFTTKNIRDGLQFVGVDPSELKWPHLYTRHTIDPGTASCIFPCIDDHGQNCAWSISIKFPRTLGDALGQPLATQKNGPTAAHMTNGTGPGAAHHDPYLDFGLSEEDKLLEMTALCSGYVADEIIDPADERKKIVTFDLDKKTSAQKLAFAVGPFEAVDVSGAWRPEADDEKLGANALKIQAFCLPGRADEVFNTCQALPSAADFFTLTFARYPFEEYRLCFVDDMVEDTLALHSLAFASSRLLFPENVVDPDVEVDVTRKLVHSLATQWSGINLLPSRRCDLWVVIGIAHYMTDLYLKKLCGNNDYRFHMKTLSDRLVDVDIDRPSLYDLGQYLHIGNFEMDFMRLKAPVVMFILDKRLAKAPAQTNLTRIISRILYKANIGERQSDWLINTESFRRVCEKNSKSRLESFWKQWVYGSGCPRFDVTQKFNKKKLCVEMLLRQTQARTANAPRELDKKDFFRAIKERHHGLVGGEVQPWFTGPMTIRIHEADGTPYEHIVEVKEDAAGARQCKYDIPYNTKYKRLKRSRRQRDRAAAQSAADAGENAEEALLYCLGDVLQAQEDVQEWDLLDWPPEMEKRMDQESYEWIRMDADFEWICTMKTNSESYMYVSQLQQDRDVVAQQDTMIYLARSPSHPLVSSILTRTLVDRRYFHGIRTMACSQLPRHGVAGQKDPMIGLYHLLKTFSDLCCFPGTHTPRPNDFSDRKQYIVRSAIPMAVARVRDSRGKCPERARRFLLDQIQLNNNANNPYSDNFYIVKLLDALATSLIPEKRPESEVPLEETAKTEEEDRFLAEALEEIERYRRMDEWANSYHNIWTITALDCLQRLMKAKVIPTKPLDFVQYLQDETHDLVRIKAFEALVDLGFMMDDLLFPHLLRTLSTDKSPYVRHQLLKVFSQGLAGLAFGEFSRPKEPEPKPEPGANAEASFMDVDDDDAKDDMLVIEAGDKETKERREEFERKRNLDAALAALKTEMKEQFAHHRHAIQKAVWTAMNQDILGRAEVATLLEFCSLMFDVSDEWTITLPLPRRWKFSRPLQRAPNRLMVTFTPFYRAEPIRPPEPKVVAKVLETTPKPELKRLIVNPNKARIIKPPTAQPRQPSVSSTTPGPIRPEGDSIVAQAPYRPVVLAQPAAPLVKTEAASKPQKRPRMDKVNGGDDLPPATKRPKLSSKILGAGVGAGVGPGVGTGVGTGVGAGVRVDGVRVDGSRFDGPRFDGARVDGVRGDGVRVDGIRGDGVRPRKMVTLKHPHLKRILRNSRPQHGISRDRDSVHVASRKSGSPLHVRPSPAPTSSTWHAERRASGVTGYGSGGLPGKPARKPLPTGASERKPLPSGAPSSFATSRAAPAPSSGSSSMGPSKASPTPSQHGGAAAGGPPPAPKRLKLVIKKPGHQSRPPSAS
ncbi:hypothetical protein ACRALDRAFT_1076731 [Sodiomyces alcalophilus JCM 7366]|uniref:uncharacterized protein n=1 Tax=Sodiomyces alcalophilus JCM 7366 TaxID=591952 RepID=UPI0039B6D01D